MQAPRVDPRASSDASSRFRRWSRRSSSRGKRLYELARKGIEVERKPRRVEIHAFESCRVSMGQRDRVPGALRQGDLRAYPRAATSATRWDPGATLDRLWRSAVGPFNDGAGGLALQATRGSAGAGPRGARFRSSAALRHLTALRLRSGLGAQGAAGRSSLRGAPSRRSSMPSTGPVRLLGAEGELIAIASLDPVPGLPDRSWRDSWELQLDRVL